MTNKTKTNKTKLAGNTHISYGEWIEDIDKTLQIYKRTKAVNGNWWVARLGNPTSIKSIVIEASTLQRLLIKLEIKVNPTILI